VWKVFFFKIGLCSAISFKTSRRELSIDVAEHRSIMKSKGMVSILVIFQDRTMFSHIIQKVSVRTTPLVSYLEKVKRSQNGGFVFTVNKIGRRYDLKNLMIPPKIIKKTKCRSFF